MFILISLIPPPNVLFALQRSRVRARVQKPKILGGRTERRFGSRWTGDGGGAPWERAGARKSDTGVMAAHLWILVASPVSTFCSSVGTFPWKPLGEFPLWNQQLQSTVSRCLPPPNDAVSFVIGSLGSGRGWVGGGQSRGCEAEVIMRAAGCHEVTIGGNR